MRRPIKFMRLTGAQRKLVIEVTALLALMRLSLWVMPFRRVRAMADWLGRCQKTAAKASGATAEQLAWIVRSASRYVPGASCLTQALAAQIVLRRRGYQPVLRLGVARDAKKFQAHAWVECDDRVVIGMTGNFERFTPLPPLEQAADHLPVHPAEGVVP